MKFLKEHTLFESTAVDNVFIAEHLPRAPGDHVKVYLYLLMQCQSGSKEQSMAHLARDLDIEESAVKSALDYWVRRGALKRVGEDYAFVNLTQHMLTQRHAPDEQKTLPYREYNRALQTIFGNRLVRGDEYEKAALWLEELAFTEEMALCVVQYAIAKSKSGNRVSFGLIDRIAREWAQDNLTFEEATLKLQQVKRRNSGAAAVLSHLGELRRNPTVDEEALYQKWIQEWGFDHEAILAACSETTKSLNPTFAYLDSILKSLTQTQARRAEDVTQAQSARNLKRQLAGQIMATLGMRGTVTAEMLSAIDAAQDQGLSDDCLLLSAQEAARRNMGSLEGWQHVLTRFLQMGLLQPDQIQKYQHDRRKLASGLLQVMDALNVPGRLGENEISRYRQWTQDWGFSQEMVLLAASLAVGMRAPLTYLGRVLENWAKDNIRTPVAAQKKVQKQGDAAVMTGRKIPDTLRYAQKTYTDEELEARLSAL